MVIKLEIQDQIATVTLNRPEQLNALSRELRQAIAATFTELKSNDDVKVIILTGSGRAFCAGLDLKELGREGFSRDTSDLHKAVMTVGKPVIGAINGFAVTGGFELALMSDFLIGSPAAAFADTHVRMGVVPGWGLSQRLARLIGPGRARELSFTANYLDAATAERWGLLNRVVAADELLHHCRQLAAAIVEADQRTLGTVRTLIDATQNLGLEAGLETELNLSRGHAGDFEPDSLEQRRLAVTARGRDQNPSS